MAMEAFDEETRWWTNQAGWNRIAAEFLDGRALPCYGPLAPTEDSLQLLGDVRGLCVLELECGSGGSLAYLAQRGARELWGVDPSPVQLELAKQRLRAYLPQVHLVQAALECDPGLPQSYFDLIVAIYILDWSTDVITTLRLAYQWLKPGGRLIFSWEHPFYSCVAHKEGLVYLARPYGDVVSTAEDGWRGILAFAAQQRRLSTVVNAVIGAGFVLEQLIEGELNEQCARDLHYNPERWYSVPRARQVPTTCIVQASKPH